MNLLVAGETLEIVLRASVLLTLAAAAAALLWAAPAATRHSVWMAAIGGSLALPILTPLLPALRVPLPVNRIEAVVSSAWYELEGYAGAARPFPGPTNAWTAEANGDPASPASAASGTLPLDSRSQESRGATSDPRGPIAIARVPLPGTPTVMLAIWLAGVLAVLARFARGVLIVRRLAKASKVITDPEWCRLVDDLANRVGWSGRVRLLLGSGGAVPVTWGIVHPVVWLPAHAIGWEEDRRAAVLAHELAHVQRVDGLTRSIAQVALAVYWFNPLMWHAIRRLHEERERACDDVAIRMGTTPVRYADHLLQVVRAAQGLRVAGGAIAMGGPAGLERRVRAILDRSVPRHSLDSGRRAAIFSLSTAIVLSVGALRAEPEGRSLQTIRGSESSRGEAPAPSASRDALSATNRPSDSNGPGDVATPPDGYREATPPGPSLASVGSSAWSDAVAPASTPTGSTALLDVPDPTEDPEGFRSHGPSDLARPLTRRASSSGSDGTASEPIPPAGSDRSSSSPESSAFATSSSSGGSGGSDSAAKSAQSSSSSSATTGTSSSSSSGSGVSSSTSSTSTRSTRAAGSGSSTGSATLSS